MARCGKDVLSADVKENALKAHVSLSAALNTRPLDLLMACLRSDEMHVRFVVTGTALFTPHYGLLVFPVDFR